MKVSGTNIIVFGLPGEDKIIWALGFGMVIGVFWFGRFWDIVFGIWNIVVAEQVIIILSCIV